MVFVVNKFRKHELLKLHYQYEIKKLTILKLKIVHKHNSIT